MKTKTELKKDIAFLKSNIDTYYYEIDVLNTNIKELVLKLNIDKHKIEYLEFLVSNDKIDYLEW